MLRAKAVARASTQISERLGGYGRSGFNASCNFCVPPVLCASLTNCRIPGEVTLIQTCKDKTRKMLVAPAFETESDQSTAARYESLIRIATAVRSQKDARDLFALLVEELGQVIQFDAIAQYDERSNKIHWHMCAGCRKPDNVPHEIDKEETLAAWVFRHQEAVTIY